LKAGSTATVSGSLLIGNAVLSGAGATLCTMLMSMLIGNAVRSGAGATLVWALPLSTAASVGRYSRSGVGEGLGSRVGVITVPVSVGWLIRLDTAMDVGSGGIDFSGM
jgi:hypothetical protein